MAKSETVIVNKGGVGFFGLLTIVLIALKLTNHIDWGWVWVLAPLWVPIVFVVAVLLAVLLLAIGGFLLGSLVTAIKRRRK